jgi:hypothetical protein
LPGNIGSSHYTLKVNACLGKCFLSTFFSIYDADDRSHLASRVVLNSFYCLDSRTTGRCNVFDKDNLAAAIKRRAFDAWWIVGLSTPSALRLFPDHKTEAR